MHGDRKPPCLLPRPGFANPWADGCVGETLELPEGKLSSQEGQALLQSSWPQFPHLYGGPLALRVKVSVLSVSALGATGLASLGAGHPVHMHTP